MKRLSIFAICILLAGCQTPSTKRAIEASTRSDALQSTAYENVWETARRALFREAAKDLNAPSDSALRAVLVRDGWLPADDAASDAQVRNAVTNRLAHEVNVLSFWREQYALGRTLHVGIVDAKLRGGASLSGLIRNLSERVEPVTTAVSDWMREDAPADATEPATSPEADAAMLLRRLVDQGGKVDVQIPDGPEGDALREELRKIGFAERPPPATADPNPPAATAPADGAAPAAGDSGDDALPEAPGPQSRADERGMWIGKTWVAYRDLPVRYGEVNG